MGLFDRLRGTGSGAAPKQLEHCFVMSGNESLIDAFNNVFHTRASAYHGVDGMYKAESAWLHKRQADARAKALPFAGQVIFGKKVETPATLAEVLGAFCMEATAGKAFVAYIAVPPKGHRWVEEVYSKLIQQAMAQGILPFHMCWTANQDAAQYLIESFAAPVPA